MAEDKESKTEQPTAKRLDEARKQGNIPKSPDLVSWAALFILLSILQTTAGKAGVLCQRIIDEMGLLIASPDIDKAISYMAKSIADALIVIAPLALAYAALAIVGHFAQVRFVLAFQAIKPSFKKINPLTGAKRLFGPQSLFQAGKELLKTVVLGYIAYRTLWKTMSTISGNGPYAISEIVAITAPALISFMKEATLAGLIIGIIDYAYQKRKIGGTLKMTKQEVKEEHKSQDGNPEIKGKIRQKQRQMSRNRMMSAIKEADVVVVNPVHIAIALKYSSAHGAPKVVAKGAGFVAEKIRERAEEHKVPLVQDIPLARTLHKACEVDEEIPMELFEAVAKVLAFVFGLKNRGTSSGLHKMPGTPDLHEVEPLENAGV